MNIGFGAPELIILVLLAIIVVGPKDLPKMMRQAGQWMAKARKMAREFQRSFDEMARETELAELRKEVKALQTNNPISELKRDLEKTIDPNFPDIDPGPLDYGDEDPTGGQAADKPEAPKTTENSISGASSQANKETDADVTTKEKAV